MDQSLRLTDVLEAVSQLSVDEQAMLVEVVRRRLAEHGRKCVLADIEESRQEFAAGRCRPMSVDEIMDDITS